VFERADYGKAFSHKLSSIKKIKQREKTLSGCWWLMPVILGAREVEIRRIVVQASLSKYFSRSYLEK
jgi:hypothetical protein